MQQTLQLVQNQPQQDGPEDLHVPLMLPTEHELPTLSPEQPEELAQSGQLPQSSALAIVAIAVTASGTAQTDGSVDGSGENRDCSQLEPFRLDSFPEAPTRLFSFLESCACAEAVAGTQTATRTENNNAIRTDFFT